MVELHKRGLLLIRLLLILQEGNKIRSANGYDIYIMVEVPDSATHPKLSSLVSRHMKHGKKRKTSTCMKDGQCKFHYTRAFIDKYTREAWVFNI